MSHVFPFSPGAPRLEPSTSGIGPGPMSPIWQRPAAVAAVPQNQWAALADELSALRRACFDSLREETPGGQLLLGLAERADLNEKLRRLQAANLTELRAWHRSSAVAAWPDPVLPSTLLWGARDLAAVLGTAIRAAVTLSERAGRGSRA
jgi:hypothetical protein